MKFLAAANYLFFSFLSIVLGTSVLVLGQSSSPPNPTKPEVPKPSVSFEELLKNYPDKVDLRNADHSDHFSMKWLRRDLRLADVVAHVNVVKRRLVDHTKGADCERDRGTGYCFYRLTAEVKKVYKGDETMTSLEFFGSSDAEYAKSGFMGEKVVFLARTEPEAGKAPALGTMENTTRWIAYNVLVKMKAVIDPTAKVDEADKSEPYSRLSIEKNFDDSTAVAYVEALNFRADPDSSLDTGAIVTAVVKEVFKGDLKVGETVEYREDFLHRNFQKSDLGEQILYLENFAPRAMNTMERDKVSGKWVLRKGEIKEKAVSFKNLQYTEGFIKHNILEKLRDIAARLAKAK